MHPGKVGGRRGGNAHPPTYTVCIENDLVYEVITMCDGAVSATHQLVVRSICIHVCTCTSLQ